jgi:hypothetical protein
VGMSFARCRQIPAGEQELPGGELWQESVGRKARIRLGLPIASSLPGSGLEGGKIGLLGGHDSPSQKHAAHYINWCIMAQHKQGTGG